ncbi:MAG: hypothetical protein LBK54_00405 [Propionibacteriaceae bacterium]|jgi:hypothetical protein|nr:hypothetical protein [Propionibacteriaceae bacterium]
MEVARSALKHGVSPADAVLAAERFVVAYQLGEDPVRELRLGFDSKARPLETVVLINAQGTEIVIHAMPARPASLDLLLGGEER